MKPINTEFTFYSTNKMDNLASFEPINNAHFQKKILSLIFGNTPE